MKFPGVLTAAVLCTVLRTANGQSCGGSLVSSPTSASLTSPNYGHYGPNLHCTWTISASSGSAVELTLESFHLESFPGCAADSLRIYDSDSASGTVLLSPSCGSRISWPAHPTRFLSSGNAVTLQFITDASVSGTGFRISYREVATREEFFLAVDSRNGHIHKLNRLGQNVDTIVSGLPNPVAVGYDPIDRKVYFTDVQADTISRVNIDGSSLEVIATIGVSVPDGLVVDSVLRLLYWTDAGTNTITKAALDGSGRSTFIRTGLDQPRDIVILKQLGYIYWSDWGSPAKIERVREDGTDRETLISTDLGWPNGLALDFYENKLYWADAQLDRIERSEFDGSQRQLIQQFREEVHPFGLVVLEEAIIWTDWISEGIDITDRNFRNPSTTIVVSGQTTRYHDLLYHSSDALYDGDIRLVGGRSTSEGRVEVYHNNMWGTVCDDSWDDTDAGVVCSQLGLGNAGRALSSAYFGRGIGPIWLDDVACTGSESRLDRCPEGKWGSHNCHHGEDAGVRCVVAVRLVDGSTPQEGRVEVFHDGQWGTVCDDSWDINDADVVCQQLGFSDSGEAVTSAAFGSGTGPIWLDDVQCTGSESHIGLCTALDWGKHNCGHHEDAGVRCITKVRLVGGSTPQEGRVEVFYDGQWGTVCDDVWDANDAAVVCRQLGFSDSGEAVTSAGFGPGTDPIWLDDVQCTGSESHIGLCTALDWGTHNCGHGEDAGVRCGANVRLVDGSTLQEGRVEVFHDGQWGTVCDDYWDATDAAVVCRQLGFGESGEAVSSAVFGLGTGQIWLDNVRCAGSESDIGLCPANDWGSHDCSHGEDAGVRCVTNVRLVGGSTQQEGRVEVFYNGQWGTICDDYWDANDAAVVCRQLDLGDSGEAVSSAAFGAGTDPIWLDDVHCTGSEDHIGLCPALDWGSHNCGHSEDAGVRCVTRVRLVGGSTPQEGRVEVFHGGQWGTVCDDYWDANDAAVVCRQLGLGDSGEAVARAAFGPGTDPIWLDDVQCTGSERHIGLCTALDWGTHNCGHGEDAGVRCGANDGAIRLVGGSSRSEGRVEVFHNSLWGTVCDDSWGATDAGVVCAQLGLGNIGTAFSSAYFGPGSGPIWLDDVYCRGSESRLDQCSDNGWGSHNCNHGEDAGVRCG